MTLGVRRRATVHLWLDLTASVVLVLVAASGIVLRWGLPPGRGRAFDAAVLGWCRHDWRELHVWVAAGFLLLVVVHVALHWSWVRAMLWPRRRPAATASGGAADPAAPSADPAAPPADLGATLSAGAREFVEEAVVNCARCEHAICREGTDCTGTGEEALGWYDDPVDRQIHQAAARVEAEGYGRLCRIEELLRFCAELGIRRVGLAFCAGLADEARLLEEALRPHLEVASVCCKVCSIPKESLELPKIDASRFEASCNPIAQARMLAEAGTELNCIVGLCLGHDLLFTRHSAAPVTTLIVKDRVLGHNPVAALHSSYHRKRFQRGSGARRRGGSGAAPPGGR